ncbi:hypothetical protein BJV85_003582 [Clostridium acetobutylicum]|uniref:Uncharacterized protein n=1 Tax=Clostridium acetobutylicum (strain ATCC 824 / DSM 792 / JCM 1419 / IAM 19013 / LMG 5710 / NBRC 13948 / NRRL B-527 / VKM B-1787 / 2291 / W) TaxID=272562 RepID=Q97LW9_CLOAB|nr:MULTISPECIES: hypothetical protein [Clostridium]AAK78415.1 Hypothetical protein CA_C0435 [Clostridium acetobutylicum ATCC 824]ADZ19485.1 Conserved hypothetical protein [Clostridium acetobutylicum EA 2018]AEI31241.1 hypothetical protein SMB_G0444 [Clostridium acetobutylicum DSM 1731]AWV80138.1 hypothetical protein DK921_08535 [Clostridium acetobutylicum]KHD37790.1 hypothetical protein NL50_06320 [Clostridium acetobutylicum]
MKNNIIYVDFLKKCKTNKNANLFYTILNTLKALLKFNRKNYTGPKNNGTFDNNRRIL